MRETVYPRETLREDLDALGRSAAELARRIDVQANRITETLSGQRAIADDTALRFGRSFGASGEFWLILQNLYDLRGAGRRNGAMTACLQTVDADEDSPAAG